jgi:DNA-binding NarL/FixJ family response regulator
MKILLVDDHELFLEGLYTFLTLRGFNIVGTAHDGYEAIAQARALRPDVVLMDMQMPRCTGKEAMRQLKSEMPGLQVILMTMTNNPEERREMLREGAAAYFVKSVDPEEMLKLLASADPARRNDDLSMAA